VPGAASVHDLHVWTIASGLVALSCHVRAEDGAAQDELLRSVQGHLRAQFGIAHTTVQIEPCDFEEPDAEIC
jgi:cobalt-zinc-cadmium efflux system protein